MDNLPVFLRVDGKRAAVVGGGSAAARRTELLARAGANVAVYATALDDEFRALRGVAFEHVPREPERSHLDGCVVCYVATGDAETDARIARRLKGAGTLINVADQPQLCDFIAPSIIDRSPLVLADLDRRRLADARAPVALAARKPASRRLRPPRRLHGASARGGGRAKLRKRRCAPALLGARAR